MIVSIKNIAQNEDGSVSLTGYNLDLSYITPIISGYKAETLYKSYHKMTFKIPLSVNDGIHTVMLHINEKKYIHYSNNVEIELINIKRSGTPLPMYEGEHIQSERDNDSSSSVSDNSSSSNSIESSSFSSSEAAILHLDMQRLRLIAVYGWHLDPLDPTINSTSYIEISSLANSANFGNLSFGQRNLLAACSNCHGGL